MRAHHRTPARLESECITQSLRAGESPESPWTTGDLDIITIFGGQHQEPADRGATFV